MKDKLKEVKRIKDQEKLYTPTESKSSEFNYRKLTREEEIYFDQWDHLNQ